MLLIITYYILQCFDCWLDGRKGIQPIKSGWWGAGVVICLGWSVGLHMAQLMPLPITISCSSKCRLVLPFWYRLTQVVPDKGPLNVSLPPWWNKVYIYITLLPTGIMVMSICLSVGVCSWAYLWKQWTTHTNFAEFSVQCAFCLWPCHDPPSVALQYVMHIRFWGWRYVFP